MCIKRLVMKKGSKNIQPTGMLNSGFSSGNSPLIFPIQILM